ncbi:hypothetical protein PIB30_022624 [Stylosanthes scabra]|uniref:Protein kinase domain-containing protein n=1 Tax=Stylosanthes scabra TaxID=79078 RepID=A0ABU6S9D2_9FABA|nr:hypothetical protein [Stylosanthes scabra]
MIALKVMTRDSIQASLEFKKEIEMLCQLHHPNLISLIGFCNQEKEKIGVYEYMANGTLSDYLSDRNKEPLSWNKRLDICIGIASALHYLHSGAKRSIFHRDVNPSNILLDKNMKAKLANFTISLQGALSTLKPKEIKVDKIVGTSALMAPEYAMHEHTLEETMDPTLKGKVAAESWKVFSNVIQSCLEYEADERPTMGEVEVLLEHALSLQQQADVTNNAAHCYTLSSTTPCLSCRERYNEHALGLQESRGSKWHY